tara:strand:+ start:40238 stop:42322 length:2085 start_codon:yes stop_codon:yes gene_type:complete
MEERYNACLNASITQLDGVGKKTAELLSNINISTVRDAIFHLPKRYEDRSRILPISEFAPGEKACLVGEIVDVQMKHGRKRNLLVTVKDGSGVAFVRLFSFGKHQLSMLVPGRLMHCYGELKIGKYGPEMPQPEYRIVKRHELKEPQHFTPIYGLTQGITHTVMSKVVKKAVAYLDSFDISLPSIVLDSNKEPNLLTAIKMVHNPPVDDGLACWNDGKHPVQLRLIKEELLAYSLSVLRLKVANESCKGTPFPPSSSLRTEFLTSLPFAPTGAQQRVVDEIDADINQEKPMMRLVQGDVGSGKTLVAALSALSVIESGAQVALMAPTEILAEQHAQTFKEWLSPLGISVGWLSGKMKKSQRKNVLNELSDGSMQMIVGTHAIFQDDVTFHHLGMMIIDEQHRFGVHQRLSLREKGKFNDRFPHQLVMTATPIPRTLAMVAYAELSTSIIDELPPGRTPVKTVAVPDHRREDIIDRIGHVCREEKRQVYWVCTLIEESEVLGSQAVSETYRMLQELLPTLRIGMVHGKLDPAEKQKVMSDFSDGSIDVLVATTVIEVGVNVPNASLMIIENPDRLGLSQLHQLRGRVGRGAAASSCVMLYSTPMSEVSRKRIAVMRETNDGFVIAQRDLELRGAGELLGTRQTGLANLTIADMERDAPLIPTINDIATSLWESDPNQASMLIKRWGFNVEQYGNV